MVAFAEHADPGKIILHRRKRGGERKEDEKKKKRYRRGVDWKRRSSLRYEKIHREEEEEEREGGGGGEREREREREGKIHQDRFLMILFLSFGMEPFDICTHEEFFSK